MADGSVPAFITMYAFRDWVKRVIGEDGYSELKRAKRLQPPGTCTDVIYQVC